MALATAAGLALTTGCAHSPQQVAGEAGPVGAATPPPSASPSPSRPPTPPSSSPSSSVTPTKTSSKPRTTKRPKPIRVIGPADVLGPTGLGKLQIGMTYDQAEATGMVEAGEGSKRCGSWYLKPDRTGDTTVGWTTVGVSSIPAFGKLATPEGIRIGSNLADVERAYPDLTGQPAEKQGHYGDGLAVAGGEDKYADVHYSFLFVDGSVVKMKLEHDDQRGC